MNATNVFRAIVKWLVKFMSGILEGATNLTLNVNCGFWHLVGLVVGLQAALLIDETGTIQTISEWIFIGCVSFAFVVFGLDALNQILFD